MWRRDVHKEFWWGDLRERGHLEDIEADHHQHNNNNNNNNNISFMELGHLLTRSVSRIQKSLQRSTMIPSASLGVVFHYPG